MRLNECTTGPRAQSGATRRAGVGHPVDGCVDVRRKVVSKRDGQVQRIAQEIDRPLRGLFRNTRSVVRGVRVGIMHLQEKRFFGLGGDAFEDGREKPLDLQRREIRRLNACGIVKELPAGSAGTIQRVDGYRRVGVLTQVAQEDTEPGVSGLGIRR